MQNKIAESRFTLPITAAYAILVCFACRLISDRLWTQMILLIVSTYLVIELNNTNSLIRIYSRMVSSTFLVLVSAANILFTSIEGGIVQLCIIGCYTALFYAYQNKQASGHVFYAFLCIGIASTVFIQIIFFVPILWILLTVNILAFSNRTFWASVLGLIAPYWFVGGYYIYTDEIDKFIQHFTNIIQFQPLFDYSAVTEHQIVTFAYIVLMTVIGTIHYLRNSYADKIRTRMLYELFIVMSISSAGFIFLQPRHFDILMRILIVNTAPLIAHFIALTRTRLTNIAFYGIIGLSIGITAYNLWMH